MLSNVNFYDKFATVCVFRLLLYFVSGTFIRDEHDGHSSLFIFCEVSEPYLYVCE